MKIRIAFLALLLALLAPGRNATAGVSVSISGFYDTLSPHGEWFSVGRYGRCWRPARVARDWQPYLNGEWVYTDYGWTWVSSDPWGGDPYHYGTWDFDDEFGWYWIPGTIWAPAWVTWHYSDSTIGWAPVRPTLSLGSSGYLGPALTVSRRSYIFVPAGRFVGANVATVRLPVAQNTTLFAQTRASTRFASSRGVLTSGGPSIHQVERATRGTVAHVTLSDAHTRGVPLRESLHQGRGAVIAPAAERAKFTGGHPAAHEANAPVHEQKREQVHQQNVAKHETHVVQHENRTGQGVTNAPAPQHHETHARAVEPAPAAVHPAPVVHERHDAPVHQAPVAHEAPHREAPQHVERAAPEHHAPPAQPPGQVKRNDPQGPPPQHGNGQEPKRDKEHG